MKRLLFTIAFSILFCGGVFAQNIDKISSRCPSPNRSVYSSILITTIGDIVHTPCPSRSSIFTGIVDFSGATIIGGGVTGSGTANFVPRFTAATVLGNTPLSWDGTVYTWNTTPLSGLGTMTFTPNALLGASQFVVGGANTTLGIDVNTKLAGQIFIGNVSSGAGGQLEVNTNVNGTSSFTPNGTGNLQLGVASGGTPARIDLQRASSKISVFTTTWDQSDSSLGITTVLLRRTNTPAGTTGAQTINLMNGSVNFAAAATSLVVTDSVALATSNILYATQTNDATCTVKNVVPAAGSFTINMTAACTAETRVAFWVYN